MTEKLIIKEFTKLQDYNEILQMMQEFTEDRLQEETRDSADDEIWLLQHKPVFTLGKAGKMEHVLDPKDIPVVQSDRGGQVTYHGPGQLIAYLMLDLKHLNFDARSFVVFLEQCIITLLDSYGISAHTKENAPGVYVNGAKIASIGLRIKQDLTYHGIAINHKMDLKPFSYIHPCGYPNLPITQITDLNPEITYEELIADLKKTLQTNLTEARLENLITD